jgi:hypothetical protein
MTRMDHSKGEGGRKLPFFYGPNQVITIIAGRLQIFSGPS